MASDVTLLGCTLTGAAIGLVGTLAVCLTWAVWDEIRMRRA